MPRLRIDHHEIEVPEGATILDAARKLGLDIPTLCFHEGYPPLTSCMLCVVKIKGGNGLVPSCATPAEDGMEVESETEDIRRIRRTGLELLLSDHVGDCTAPCQTGCPLHMDIPLMLRQVAGDQLDQAIATIKKDIALPAVLGRLCTAPCERACRRREVDSPAAICLLKRYIADEDLASPTPYLPPCRPSTGKHVAIVGAGPTGLSAAYHLLQQGHACTLFDDHPEAGGTLRYRTDDDHLPRNVLDAEIGAIESLGVTFRLKTRVGQEPSIEELQAKFDAVLIAAGALTASDATLLRVAAKDGRVQIDAQTYTASLPGVFAAGEAVRPEKPIVRCVADGKAAALCIDKYLCGVEVTGLPPSLNVHAGRLSSTEIEQLALSAGSGQRVSPSGDLTEEQARAEALRCLHCDCGNQAGCRLRHYAEAYGARATRFRGDRRAFERHEQHGEVIYEPGKCILCGRCVQITTEAAEPLGLTLVGRGFDVRVGVPFNRSIVEGLQQTARRCAEACPTGALVLKNKNCTNSCQTCGQSG